MRTSATVSLPLPQVSERFFFAYTAIVVIFVSLLGGGARQGLWSATVVELISLPLLVLALLRPMPGRSDVLSRWGLILLGAIVALPFGQLVPLPPSIWTALPGRETIASGYATAGLEPPWLAISLDPAATWRCAVSLIPGASIFLAMQHLSRTERRTLLAIILGAGFLNVVLGFMQLTGGTDSPLRFYEITNTTMAVGLFANANHHATFLVVLVPFAIAWVVDLNFGRGGMATKQLSLLALLLLALVVGIGIVGSRAGLALGAVSVVGSLLIIFRSGRKLRKGVLAFTVASVLLVVLIGFQFGVRGLDSRDAENRRLADDLRWPVAVVVWHAAKEYLPVGSGAGTFVPVYQMWAPRSHLFDQYVNHAHDDWLELLLETGLAGVFLAISFLVWLFIAAVRAWRSGPEPNLDRSFARASSIAVVTMLLHSTVDYPLRSITLMGFMALCCGLMTRYLPSQSRPAEGKALSERDAAVR